MKLINFDEHFTKYVDQWLRENRSKYANADLLEEAMFEVYMRWANAPAKWLDGTSPSAYFFSFDDPAALVALLQEYGEMGVPVPEQLAERIASLEGQAVQPLMRLAFDERADLGSRVTAFNLLIQLGDEEPIERCIALLLGAQTQDELTEVCAELLQSHGRAALPALLSRLDEASPLAQEVFLDILCNFPGDERIYKYTLSAFMRNAEKRALFASYLGKLGDVRAIEPLTKSLEWEDLNYLDYIEIVGAIEALGGEVQRDREFSGDPYYESLKNV